MKDQLHFTLSTHEIGKATQQLRLERERNGQQPQISHHTSGGKNGSGGNKQPENPFEAPVFGQTHSINRDWYNEDQCIFNLKNPESPLLSFGENTYPQQMNEGFEDVFFPQTYPSINPYLDGSNVSEDNRSFRETFYADSLMEDRAKLVYSEKENPKPKDREKSQMAFQKSQNSDEAYDGNSDSEEEKEYLRKIPKTLKKKGSVKESDSDFELGEYQQEGSQIEKGEGEESQGDSEAQRSSGNNSKSSQDIYLGD